MKQLTLLMGALMIAGATYACDGKGTCCKGQKGNCKKEAKACKDKKACCKKDAKVATIKK